MAVADAFCSRPFRKCPLEAYPLWCVDGRQGIQICHGEVDPLPLQLLIYVHHAREVRAAPEGIGPRLEGQRGLSGSVSRPGLSRCLRPRAAQLLSEANTRLYPDANCPGECTSPPASAATMQVAKPWFFSGAAEHGKTLHSAYTVLPWRRGRGTRPQLWCTLKCRHSLTARTIPDD